MRASSWLVLTQLCLAAALLASSALYVHYLDPAASDFCGLDSGCEAVRRSPLAYLLGSTHFSLPMLAMLAYGGVFALSVRSWYVRAPIPDQAGLSGLRHPALALFAASFSGAAIAAALIAYQAFGLGSFCWLCLIVDISAIGAAVASFLFCLARRRSPEPLSPPLRPGAWALLAALVVGGPIGWSAVKPPQELPAGVAALYQPGKINVVEFADFQCPYCRKLHARLAPLLEQYGDEVHFVRLHKPLDEIHPMARQAAVAAVCASRAGKQEEMADALFTIPLSPAAITKAARDIGLDPEAFTECTSSATAAAAVAHDERQLPDEIFRGLPTTFIGHRQIVGALSEAAFRDALEKARGGPPAALGAAPYVGLWLGLFALVLALGRAGKRGSVASAGTRDTVENV